MSEDGPMTDAAVGKAAGKLKVEADLKKTYANELAINAWVS